MIRASFLRAIAATTVLAGALMLAGCDTDGVYQLPTRAMKELSPQTVALLAQKNMPKDSPILLRIFKEESELEVWKKDTTGHFALLKVYPICRWSGDLGPKVVEGDRQAPEGFYTITPELMNPNSNYYLAINTGFPNAFDRANDRHGAFLMIHGDCSSRGCYAMTDEQIGEIYSLAREAFLGGQPSFQIQAYPFRMTPANLARHRTNPNMAFWKMIKEGNDHFEATHLEPKVDVCDRRYVFDAQAPAGAGKPIVFNATARCPAFVVAPQIASVAAEKQRADDAQFAQLAKSNLAVAPIHSGVDGGMNRVFAVQVPNPPTQPTMGSRVVHSLFGPKPGPAPTQVAATDAAAQERGGESGFFSRLFSSGGAEPAATVTASLPKPKSAPHAASAYAAAVPHAKSIDLPTATALNAAPRKPAVQQAAVSKPRAAPQQQEANADPPALLNGAQPTLRSGSFDSRWDGLQ